MVPFDQKPLYVKKKIARAITIGIAIILFALLGVIFITKKTTKENDQNKSSSKLKDFYNTILITGQSYNGNK